MSEEATGETAGSKLRILLIAYEFPPSPSPQSLRWAYLSGRLAAFGHEVHVMTPDIGGEGVGLPDSGPGVCVHRVYPGPVRALLDRLAQRSPVLAPRTDDDGHEVGVGEVFAGIGSVEPPRLNWKGRLLERLQSLVSWLLFPDLRGEWWWPARRALPQLLEHVRPDVVVTSHEPATTLQLGLDAKARGMRWVADLGDPVLAPYTLPRWRRRAGVLERRTVHGADHVLVTTLETQALLRQRHGGKTPITVVPQGFDEQLAAVPTDPRSTSSGPLELLYSGRFYAFRDPRALVDGVLRTADVRLNIASGNVPGWLASLASDHPEQLRLLGRVPHRRLLDLQRRVDVLVNIANADSSQIPGKVYEYLGACRPILHLQAQPDDAVGRLLTGLNRGRTCIGEVEAVARSLAQLRDMARAGHLDEAFGLTLAPVEQWCWTAAARTVDRVLTDLPAR